MDWLTEELKQEIRQVFEPRYTQQLSNDETCLIAKNLTNLIEGLLKSKYIRDYEKKEN
jgi:hypothetical protein